MQKKLILSMALYCYLLLSAGCTARQPILYSVDKVQLKEAKEISVKPIQAVGATEEDMKGLFTQLLMIDEDTMLALHQRPEKVNDDYWKAYRVYRDTTNERLEKYLSSDAKRRLGQQYIQDDFHYPRLVAINDYIITCVVSIEDVSIQSKKQMDNKAVYDVAVTANAKVVNKDIAHTMYQWNNEHRYYVINKENSVAEDAYDEIKVQMSYWVEVPIGELFVVDAIKEKTTLSLELDKKPSVSNNYFISRIPYYTLKEQYTSQIYKFLDQFMKKDYQFYSYYKKTYETSHEALQILFENDLNLQQVVDVKEQTYKSSFHPRIIPLKDDMNTLIFDTKEDVIVEPHISSSKKHPVYKVTITGDAELVSGKKIVTQLTYLFVFENDTIISVQFVTQNEANVTNE